MSVQEEQTSTDDDNDHNGPDADDGDGKGWGEDDKCDTHRWNEDHYCEDCGEGSPCLLCGDKPFSGACDICEDGHRLCDDCYQMCDVCDQCFCNVCADDHECEEEEI